MIKVMIILAIWFSAAIAISIVFFGAQCSLSRQARQATAPTDGQRDYGPSLRQSQGNPKGA